MSKRQENTKKSNKSLIKKVAIITATFGISLGVSAFLFFGVENKKVYDPSFTKLDNYYTGTNAEISNTGSASQSNDITMTYANTNGNSGNKTITISDFDELRMFSLKCSTTTAFLSYNYKLIANIDWDNTSDFTPIGNKNNYFSGTFDGQGYQINGLTLKQSESEGANYEDLYYSMFNYNAGTITNLGLDTPTLTISNPVQALGESGGISYLVGKNTSNGEITNCFIVDDDSALDEKAGINGFGGCRIATFVVNNEGVMTNNYAVVDAVINPKVSDFIEFNNLVLDNSGSITDCYYFDNSISTFSQSSNKAIISYKSAYGFIDKTAPYYGERLGSIQDLVSKLENKNWYTASHYGQFADATKIEYGLQRGVSYNDSTATITINNEKDFAYMYELFNASDKMASNALTYRITANLNLAKIPVASYTYKKGIGATIIGDNITGTPTLANTQTSSYPTIYNADVMNSSRIAKSAGVDCYGLFNYLIGRVENLNIVPLSMDLNDVNTSGTSNVKGIGVVSGYVEKGEVKNVNVYATITNSANKNIGEYYLGGITGVLGGEGKINNVTTAGSITLNSTTNTIPASSSYMKGIAIGGVVGYIESSNGAVYDALNGMNITSYLGTSTNYAIGGVVGAGYTMNYGLVEEGNQLVLKQTSELENKGNIIVGNASNHTYSELYVSGIIGRHLGALDEVSSFTNNGNITVYPNTNKAYVSGVENSTIQTSATNGTGLTASLFKNGAGNTLFYASSFTNGGSISITDGSISSTTNLHYTDVLNVDASNGVTSVIHGLYNVSYYEKYNNTSSKGKTEMAAQAINMNTINSFAPVLNVNATENQGLTTVTQAYNLRSINYTLTATASKTFNYAGVALGENINYENIRNEGDLTFTLNQAITGNLTVSGLFNEISSGNNATNLYNAGNIDIKYTAIFTGNIYASGICYQNKNGFSNSDIELFNPSNDKYDKNLVGSLNNAINAGKVSVTNPNYSSLQFTNYYDIRSSNGDVITERHFYVNSAPAANLKGTICTSGITVLNESVITNTFNIADIFAANYINDTKRNEVNASGLVTYNVGRYAIIENSANDGDIKAINLSFYMVFNNGQSNVNDTTARYAYVTASGIVAHNDEYLNGSTPTVGSTNNSKQIIAFTINYGAVYSYNYRRNSTSSADEDFRTISSGIIGQGLLNVVNVMNYGNIYGSEASGGIFGICFFNTFASEVNSSNVVNLANTINYAPVLVIDKGQLNFSNSSTYVNQTYSSFVALNSSSTNYFTSIPVYSKDYFNGSIFGIINFNGDENAKYVQIRYIISFNEDINLVSAEAQTPELDDEDIDLSTFYSAYLAFESDYVLDKYIGKDVVYSPLTSGSERINGTTYNGVFNSNFSFYQAILGNSAYLDIANHRTDIFISDYFEFIGATYVNTILLDKIGWGSIAYNAAADAFATDLDGVAQFITYAKNVNNAQYQTLINEALNTDTWLSKCDSQTLLSVTNAIIEKEDNAALLAMVDYIFSSSSTSYSIITKMF